MTSSVFNPEKPRPKPLILDYHRPIQIHSSEGMVAQSLTAIILAAGEGTRMNSKLSKVLHPLGGQPMIDYALQNAEALKPQKIYVIVGAHAEEVIGYIDDRAIPVVQKQRLGTGHAVQQVMPFLKKAGGNVVILYGDAPLTQARTVQALRQFHNVQDADATLLSARVTEPFGYGRIVRHEDGTVNSIVEHKDASEEELSINEINAGLYIFKTAKLIEALGKLKANNAKKEYYLTDTIHYLINQGGKVHALMVPDATEVLGVNDREQLAEAHRLLNLRRIEEHQRNGVTFMNPVTVEVSAETVIGKDTVIEGHVQLLGDTVLGENCHIESGSYLRSAKLGKNVVVRSSRILESTMGDDSDAGPFAHIRGGSVLDKNVHVGTGTELKNAHLASGAKAGHFSYIGDAHLGKDVNVGAGCVFANYDGKNKYHSKIGDKVFLGSNSTLVAPVTIGKGAVIGAGSVVTRDVPAGKTVVGVPAKVFVKKKG